MKTITGLPEICGTCPAVPPGAPVTHHVRCADCGALVDGCLAREEGPHACPSPRERLPTYTVAPWSRVDPRRATGSSEHDECAICGRPIKNPDAAHMAVVIDGGAAWGDETSDEHDAGYMGGFLVGPDCHKRFVRKE